MKTYILQFIHNDGNGWAIINANGPAQAIQIFETNSQYKNPKVVNCEEQVHTEDSMQIVYEGSITTLGQTPYDLAVRNGFAGTLSEFIETLKGPKGDKGEQGPKGPKGDAFKYEDFTAKQLEALRGPQGIKGDKGDPGEQGPQGIQGIQGEQGKPGTTDYNELLNTPKLAPVATVGTYDSLIGEPGIQLSKTSISVSLLDLLQYGYKFYLKQQADGDYKEEEPMSFWEYLTEWPEYDENNNYEQLRKQDTMSFFDKGSVTGLSNIFIYGVGLPEDTEMRLYFGNYPTTYAVLGLTDKSFFITIKTDFTTLAVGKTDYFKTVQAFSNAWGGPDKAFSNAYRLLLSPTAIDEKYDWSKHTYGAQGDIFSSYEDWRSLFSIKFFGIDEESFITNYIPSIIGTVSSDSTQHAWVSSLSTYQNSYGNYAKYADTRGKLLQPIISSQYINYDNEESVNIQDIWDKPADWTFNKRISDVNKVGLIEYSLSIDKNIEEDYERIGNFDFIVGNANRYRLYLGYPIMPKYVPGGMHPRYAEDFPIKKGDNFFFGAEDGVYSMSVGNVYNIVKDAEDEGEELPVSQLHAVYSTPQEMFEGFQIIFNMFLEAGMRIYNDIIQTYIDEKENKEGCYYQCIDARMLFWPAYDYGDAFYFVIFSTPEDHEEGLITGVQALVINDNNGIIEGPVILREDIESYEDFSDDDQILPFWSTNVTLFNQFLDSVPWRAFYQGWLDDTDPIEFLFRFFFGKERCSYYLLNDEDVHVDRIVQGSPTQELSSYIYINDSKKNYQASLDTKIQEVPLTKFKISLSIYGDTIRLFGNWRQLLEMGYIPYIFRKAKKKYVQSGKKWTGGDIGNRYIHRQSLKWVGFGKSMRSSDENIKFNYLDFYEIDPIMGEVTFKKPLVDLYVSDLGNTILAYGQGEDAEDYELMPAFLQVSDTRRAGKPIFYTEYRESENWTYVHILSPKYTYYLGFGRPDLVDPKPNEMISNLVKFTVGIKVSPNDRVRRIDNFYDRFGREPYGLRELIKFGI